MENKQNFKKKVDRLKQHLFNKESFTQSDVAEILIVKKSTVNWILWNLQNQGYIQNIGKGLYTFHLRKNQNVVQPILSQHAENILYILSETGYEYFITGLEILSIFMQHVPENYPLHIFVNKYSLNDTVELLRRENIQAMDYSKIKKYTDLESFGVPDKIVLLSPTREYIYADVGIASFEKAFVDLYFDVTRKKYPLSLQELVRIYQNMKRRINLDPKRLIKIASRRSIDYDIRYIVDHEKIQSHAYDFVKLLEGRETV